MISIIKSEDNEVKLTQTDLRGFCLSKDLLNPYSNEGYLKALSIVETESLHSIAIALWVLSEKSSIEEIEQGLIEIVKDKKFVKNIENSFSQK